MRKGSKVRGQTITNPNCEGYLDSVNSRRTLCPLWRVFVFSLITVPQVKEIIELLDQSARAVRSGPAGGSRVKAGEVAPSVKVIRRQTVLVSATLDKGVSRLATILLSK